MKKMLAGLALFAATTVNAATTTIDVEYDILTLQASCEEREVKGEKRLFVRFDDASIAKIKETGHKKTRFKKHPREICENGELPKVGEGVKDIEVLLYTLDLNALNQIL